MGEVPFKKWWRRVENQQDFWRSTCASNGGLVGVSLGETPRSIFRQILQLLKCEYHDRNVGYGNLLEGVRIDDETKKVDLKDYGHNPKRRRLAESSAAIKQDMLDFEELVTWVEKLIYQEKRVKPAYSSKKFHELCRLLDNGNHYKTVDELRRFGFYMRNNPLFWNEADKFLFFRKVLTIKEFDYVPFSTNVRLRDLRGWSQHVHDKRLQDVRDYDRNRNQNTYAGPAGSIVFYRNCLGHLRKKNAPYDDAQILRALEDDLPHVIPVWFYDLVRELDLDNYKCWGMCKHTWMEFLSKQPSVFT